MSLHDLMKEKGLTIEKLSDKSNVSVSTIKRALTGENINATTVQRLATGLDVSEDELKAHHKEPSKPDYIAGLVLQQLNKLNALGLVFEPSRKHPELPVYLDIEQDICGDLSYFPDEFEKQVNKAEKKNQLNALKELVLYCTAYLLDRSFEVDLNQTSVVNLRDGDNAWELRLHINKAIQQLENLEIKLIQCADTGATTLAPVERAYELELNVSGDDMELLLSIAKSINAQEPLTNKPCPEQLRKGNSEDLKAFKVYCKDLNSHLDYFRNTLKNVFAFDKRPIPDKLASLLTEYLPALRVMIIQADDGVPFLVSGHKIHVVLINLLKLIAKRENDLFGTAANDEGDNMKRSTTIYNTTINTGDGATTSTGNNNQIIIGEKLNELLPLIREIQTMLSPNYSADSQEMKAFDEAINANPQAPQDAINKMGAALKTAEKLINKGSHAAKLYDKALALLYKLTALIL
jgi:transcriptional regulator with XRE-family HTH domain